MTLADDLAVEVCPLDRTLPAALADRWSAAGADGVEIACYGLHEFDSHRPALLFAHANGFNAGCYGPFLERLQTRLNVFAYDIRGHGASGKPDPGKPENYDLRNLGLDLAAVYASIVTRTGPETALHFAAHSVGGIGFLIWCGDSGQAPFASATLFEPPLYPAHGSPRREAMAARNPAFVRWAAKRRLSYRDVADFARECAGFVTYRTIAPEMMRALVASAIAPAGDGNGYQLRCPGGIESRVYERGPYTPTFEIGSTVQVPTLLFHGDEDLLDEAHPIAETIRELARAMPEAEARQMTGQHHLMVLEAPEKCAQAVFERVFRD